MDGYSSEPFACVFLSPSFERSTCIKYRRESSTDNSYERLHLELNLQQMTKFIHLSGHFGSPS